MDDEEGIDLAQAADFALELCAWTYQSRLLNSTLYTIYLVSFCIRRGDRQNARHTTFPARSKWHAHGCSAASAGDANVNAESIFRYNALNAIVVTLQQLSVTYSRIHRSGNITCI